MCVRYPKGRHAGLAVGPAAIPGMAATVTVAYRSSDLFVSTALMTAVEAQQPGYLSHSDAAAAPFDRFPD